MARSSFKAGKEYKVSEVISTLNQRLDAGEVKDAFDKARLVKLLEPYSGEVAVFKPTGKGWGKSPFNPRTWHTLDGKNLIPGLKRSRKKITPAMKKKVWAKTGGFCYSCGEKLSRGNKMWIEHITPFSAGGSDELDNLLPGCKLCNWTRRNHIPHQIRRILSVGAQMIKQMDQETELGKKVESFMEKKDRDLEKTRKKSDGGLLVYKRQGQ
ncbi:MAG: HNH endonuclease [Pirellulaceae bacterium]|nr:HNH endonuclease [Pirellulaceae bacterium]